MLHNIDNVQNSRFNGKRQWFELFVGSEFMCPIMVVIKASREV